MEKDLCFSSCCFDMDTSTTSTHSELRFCVLLWLRPEKTRKNSAIESKLRFIAIRVVRISA